MILVLYFLTTIIRTLRRSSLHNAECYMMLFDNFLIKPPFPESPQITRGEKGSVTAVDAKLFSQCYAYFLSFLKCKIN